MTVSICCICWVNRSLFMAWFRSGIFSRFTTRVSPFTATSCSRPMAISRPSSTKPPRSIASSASGSACTGSFSSAPAMPASIKKATRKHALRFIASPILCTGPVRQGMAQSRASQPFEQRRPGQPRPVIFCQEARTSLIQVAADYKRRAIPVLFELRHAVSFQAPGRIAHQHLCITDALDHHEMPVTAQGHQRNHRNPHLVADTRQRHSEPIRLITLSLQVTLHIQHRKALLTHLVLIRQRQHIGKYFLLRNRAVVVEVKHRRQRLSATTEIVLLPHHVSETPVLKTADRYGNITTGSRYQNRTGKNGGPERTAQGTSQHLCLNRHSPPPDYWLRRMLIWVLSWITTWLPVFWITVATPLMFWNAWSEIRLSPVRIFPDNTLSLTMAFCSVSFSCHWMGMPCRPLAASSCPESMGSKPAQSWATASDGNPASTSTSTLLIILAMTHLLSCMGCPQGAAHMALVATRAQVRHHAHVGLGHAANASVLGNGAHTGEVGRSTGDLVGGPGVNVGATTIGIAIGDVAAGDRTTQLGVVHEHFHRQVQRSGAVVRVVTAVAVVGVSVGGGVVRTVTGDLERIVHAGAVIGIIGVV